MAEHHNRRLGFTVTLAAAFTGYYKRSYFLLQTADSFEEEANAFTLGVGPHSDFRPDQEQQALKLSTQRVEEHRNELRRRQQPAGPAGRPGPADGVTIGLSRPGASGQSGTVAATHPP